MFALADMAACISGDFHTMHLNMHGEDFDTMHKKTLKKYYEEAADDYDSWAEAGCMFGNAAAPNVNEAAIRIGWQSLNGDTLDDAFNRSGVVSRTDMLLKEYIDALLMVYNNCSSECALEIGIQNDMQTRLAYWAKEYAYFNVRRKV